MPGHIKLVKGAVDPDPTEFLLPSIEMKREDQQKPYDRVAIMPIYFLFSLASLPRNVN